MHEPAAQLLATYQVFWVNSLGWILAIAATVNAASDEDAIQQARVIAAGYAIEIWCSTRWIATLNSMDPS